MDEDGSGDVDWSPDDDYVAFGDRDDEVVGGRSDGHRNTLRRKKMKTLENRRYRRKVAMHAKSATEMEERAASTSLPMAVTPITSTIGKTFPVRCMT